MATDKNCKCLYRLKQLVEEIGTDEAARVLSKAVAKLKRLKAEQEK